MHRSDVPGRVVVCLTWCYFSFWACHRTVSNMRFDVDHSQIFNLPRNKKARWGQNRTEAHAQRLTTSLSVLSLFFVSISLVDVV